MFSLQNFNSNLFQILENGNRNNLTNASVVNDVKYNFTDTYLGVHYKMLLGKFTINPGFNAHQYVMSNDQNGSNFSNKINRIFHKV